MSTSHARVELLNTKNIRYALLGLSDMVQYQCPYGYYIPCMSDTHQTMDAPCAKTHVHVIPWCVYLTCRSVIVCMGTSECHAIVHTRYIEILHCMLEYAYQTDSRGTFLWLPLSVCTVWVHPWIPRWNPYSWMTNLPWGKRINCPRMGWFHFNGPYCSPQN